MSLKQEHSNLQPYDQFHFSDQQSQDSVQSSPVVHKSRGRPRKILELFEPHAVAAAAARKQCDYCSSRKLLLFHPSHAIPSSQRLRNTGFLCNIHRRENNRFQLHLQSSFAQNAFEEPTPFITHDDNPDQENQDLAAPNPDQDNQNLAAPNPDQENQDLAAPNQYESEYTEDEFVVEDIVEENLHYQNESEYPDEEFVDENLPLLSDIENVSDSDYSLHSTPVLRRSRGRPKKVRKAVSSGRPRSVPRRGEFSAIDLDTLNEDTIVYLDHGYMDKKCLYCGAFYFKAECNSQGRYTKCCSSGTILLPNLPSLLPNFPVLHSLFLRQVVGYSFCCKYLVTFQGELWKIFASNYYAYRANAVLAFASSE